MRNVGFHHIRGIDAWRRHHHHRTTLDAAEKTLRLATLAETGAVEPTIDRAAWLQARAPGVVLQANPVRAGCVPWGAMVGSSEGPVLVTESAAQDETPPELSGPVKAVARDRHGRLWLVRPDLKECWLYDVQDDAWRGQVAFPPDAEPVDLAFDGGGAYLIDTSNATAWCRPDNGEWSAVALPDDTTPVSACTLGYDRAAIVLHHDDEHRLLLLRHGQIRANLSLATLHFPLHCVGLSSDRIAIADLDAEPGAPTRFHVFAIQDTLVSRGRPREVHAFDGRALLADEAGVLWATTARGLRRLYPVHPLYQTRGGVETVALDSGRFGCTWHRVFIDACLPEGTRLRVSARAADRLYPEEIAGERLDPVGQEPLDVPAGRLGSQAPLGAAVVDDEGWVPLGRLDERRAFADMPWPPPAAEEANFSTYEGLIKSPPGRYLWLRVELEGTARRTPQLYGIRVSYPRPSLLKYLPPYWSADDARADRVERFLALFEGELTQLDERVAGLRHLFNPRVVPAETLQWLATWLSMSLDERLPLCARRALVANAVELYRTRGTVGGLTTLAEIITNAPVSIVEGFRLRRRAMPVLGAESKDDDPWVLGEGLQLGGSAPVDTASEEALAMAWDRAQERRQERLEETGIACPPRVPPRPADDAQVAYFSNYAHRFTVVVTNDIGPELLSALDDAIEAWKPAHTAHTICSFKTGMAPGVDAYVGLGTWVGKNDGPQPTTLGDEHVILGVGSTIGIWSGTPQEGL